MEAKKYQRMKWILNEEVSLSLWIGRACWSNAITLELNKRTFLMPIPGNWFKVEQSTTSDKNNWDSLYFHKKSPQKDIRLA